MWEKITKSIWREGRILQMFLSKFLSIVIAKVYARINMQKFSLAIIICETLVHTVKKSRVTFAAN